jgi:osmoprotectant transport system permease protein
VDFEKEAPAQAARDFLREQGLLRPDRNGKGDVIVLGSKIFAEQYILTELFAQLIRGHTDLQVSTKTGLGGTKICFDALAAGEIDLYPEYTGTGLLVILAAPPEVAASLSAGKDRVFRHVAEQFRERYNITWLPPLGFNNSYALMMREEQAARLGISSISDLDRFLRQ